MAGRPGSSFSSQRQSSLRRAIGRLEDRNKSNKSVFTCHAYYLFDFLFDPSEKSIEFIPHAFVMECVYSAFKESSKLVCILLGVTLFVNIP
jgi:hypothetical protein